jgi:NAD(P)-dependent dehydrogenase (short-subunit alcohol dehydrogenase family)
MNRGTANPADNQISGQLTTVAQHQISKRTGDLRMKKLEGKIAVVTGGNSGIGLATAKLLHQEGAKVAISGRDQNTLTKAAKEIGADTLAIRSDVSSIPDLDALFANVEQVFGRIDVLFANAGVAKFAPISDSTESLYDEVFDINVKGVFFTLQRALPHLNDGASIVLNTSFVNGAGLPATSVYAASKAAVRSFARTAAAELVGRGIRVNVVSPGPISTPIYARLGLPKEAVEAMAQGILSTVPMKRFGTPEEIATTVLFLTGSDASYITGVEINVDGGVGQV